MNGRIEFTGSGGGLLAARLDSPAGARRGWAQCRVG